MLEYLYEDPQGDVSIFVLPDKNDQFEIMEIHRNGNKIAMNGSIFQEFFGKLSEIRDHEGTPIQMGSKIHITPDMLRGMMSLFNDFSRYLLAKKWSLTEYQEWRFEKYFKGYPFAEKLSIKKIK